METSKVITLLFEISTYILFVGCIIHSIFFHSRELLHFVCLLVTSISIFGLFLTFALNSYLKYSDLFLIWIGPVPLCISLFWAIMFHVSFVPSRLFNKHQRGFLLGSVVIDSLQIFFTLASFEPLAVGFGFWQWNNITTEYYGSPLIVYFTLLVYTFSFSLFYHLVLRNIKSTTSIAKVFLYRYLGPLVSAFLAILITSGMWIAYAFIGGIKCMFPFIPTTRKPDDEAFPKAIQLAEIATIYLTILASSFYYARYYRLTNKFSFGRLLLPLIVVYYYLLFIIYTFVEKLEFLTKAPIHLAVLLTSLFFHLFIQTLPFSRDLVARLRGDRVIFEDPLLFWTGEGEVTEWDQEDAYGSMKDLTEITMISDIIKDQRKTRDKRVSIAGDI